MIADDIYSWLWSLGIPRVACSLDYTETCDDVVEVRVPAGEDPDEYLCALEQAWRDAFGDEPVVIRELRERTATLSMTLEHRSVENLKLALFGGSEVSLFGTKFYIDEVSLGDGPADYSYYSVSGTCAGEPKVSPALLATGVQAKGPRGRWGARR